MARRRPATTHGLCVVDKPAGVTSHDVVGMLRKRFDERQVGPRRHARPRCDRRARGRRRDEPPNCCGSSRRRPSATRARWCSAPRRRRSTPPASVHRHPRHGRRHDRRCPPGRRRASRRRRSSRSRRWCRRFGSTASGCTSSPARASRSNGRRDRSRSTRSPSTPDRSRVCCRSRSSCSAGTYIRTLAADLGHLLGGGAHLRNLRRTAVGEFTIAEAGSTRRVRAAARRRHRARPRAGRHRRSDRRAGRQRSGAAALRRRCTVTDRGRVFGPDGTLLAVYEAFRRDQVKPSVVLPTAIGG